MNFPPCHPSLLPSLPPGITIPPPIDPLLPLSVSPCPPGLSTY